MNEEMKMTELGTIPSEWRALKFGEVFEIIKSYSFSRNKLTAEETSSKVQNVHYGDIHSKFNNNHLDFDKENVPYIIDEFITGSHNQFLKDGDIVIADVSEDLVDIGKCIGLINVKNRKVLGGLHTIVARDTKSIIAKGFGAYIFKHPEVLKELRSIATGMSVYGISKGNLNKLYIPVPPLLEQRKITYILSTIKNAIEQQDKLIQTTTELKKALMQKLFTEGTKGEKQKQTEIGLVPESWEVVELDDICERVALTVEPNPIGNKPYVGLEHIVPGQIYLTSWGMECDVVSSKAIFKKGEILYGKLRPYLDKAIIAHFDGISSTDILIFTGKNDIQNDFLIHFFHTEKLIDFAKSTTTGVQHPRTSWNSLRKLKLGLPSELERDLITQTLNLFEDKLSFLQKKKQSLSDLFKTLLHELMTGQRRVHEIDFKTSVKQYQIAKQSLTIAAEI